jgi:hypothetical protein
MPDNNLPFNSLQFKETWEEWIQYRRERHLPCYKPIGLKRTFAGLVRDSEGIEETAIKMIINSIEKNWQGIFKINNNGSQNLITNSKPGTSAARMEAARKW